MVVHFRVLFFLWMVKLSQSFLVVRFHAVKGVRTSTPCLASANDDDFEKQLIVVKAKMHMVEKGIELSGTGIQALSEKMDANYEKLSNELKEVNNRMDNKYEKLNNKMDDKYEKQSNGMKEVNNNLSREIKEVNKNFSKRIQEVNDNFFVLWIFLSVFGTAGGMAIIKYLIASSN